MMEGEGDGEEGIGEMLVRCMQSLHARGLITGSGGNASARLGGGEEILITPSGVYKAGLGVGDLVRMRLDGEVLEGRRKPSSEWRMHAEIYSGREDVNAVVHAHSPFTTGIAIAGRMIGPITPEVALLLPDVEVIEYACPGTEMLGRLVGSRIVGKRALVLQNHGVVAVGRDLLEAVTSVEVLEEGAITTFVASLMGGVNVIPKEEVELIKKVYKR
ncbi:MAG: class II aldolase/adducin family protein [Candidatus Methanosuratus sp.]|nr:class II aldolase/adducin family protein [Candidatus Methanosuratincola sp.]